MSQRQKQRTNENRAKRLGTGEGISRHGRGGGTPPIYANDGGTLQKVPVPQYVGIEVQGTTAVALASIHTHDSTGMIHMESDQRHFKANLFQVLSVWGVRFNGQCLGGYCGGVH